jgi:hypothetical protein
MFYFKRSHSGSVYESMTDYKYNMLPDHAFYHSIKQETKSTDGVRTNTENWHISRIFNFTFNFASLKISAIICPSAGTSIQSEEREKSKRTNQNQSEDITIQSRITLPGHQ